MSIGGGKIESIPVAIIIVNHVRKLFELKDSEISITLEIYGKDLPDTIIKTFSHFPFVKYMGYVTDFKERIRYADLFLVAYTFPELGLAVLEAICAGVPVAKLTANPTEEEIIDGFNGILATSPYEIAVMFRRKFVLYVHDLPIEQSLAAREWVPYVGLSRFFERLFLRFASALLVLIS